jgi:hypothetical protein
MILPSARWQSSATAVILVIPVLVVVLLSAPAWVAWPFLSADRRTGVLDFLGRLLGWVTVLAGTDHRSGGPVDVVNGSPPKRSRQDR